MPTPCQQVLASTILWGYAGAGMLNPTGVAISFAAFIAQTIFQDKITRDHNAV
jgi:hypothetical protein